MALESRADCSSWFKVPDMILGPGASEVYTLDIYPQDPGAYKVSFNFKAAPYEGKCRADEVERVDSLQIFLNVNAP